MTSSSPLDRSASGHLRLFTWFSTHCARLLTLVVLSLIVLMATQLDRAHGAEASAPSAPSARPDTEASIRISIYLLFDGNCRSAMEFYRSVFGGELTLTTVGDSPMKAMFPPALHTRVVNARVQGAGFDVSASDWLRPAQTRVQGNTVCLYVRGKSPAEVTTVFRRLAEGAEVTDPLRNEPFGLYGALNDRYGIRWMFVAEKSAGP